MDNCSIHISAYHNFAGRDWELKKVDGEWREWTGGLCWNEGGRWSSGNDAVAESMIDDLWAIAIAKIDAGEHLEDGETLATGEREGIVVDVIYRED